MGPRELYYECPEGYIWRPRRRGIFGVTKGYISGSQKGIFGFQEMFFLEGHVWETHVHTFGVQHDLLIQT